MKFIIIMICSFIPFSAYRHLKYPRLTMWLCGCIFGVALIGLLLGIGKI